MSKNNFSINSFYCVNNDKVIRGKCYLPADWKGKKLPTAIISHGFMGNLKMTKHYAEHFASWGYASFVFDFCGGGPRCSSDGKTTDMTVFTEVEDLESVLDYVSSQPFVNTEDITLMGCSQGGFVSALTAAKLKERIARLILFYPALCIPDDARAGQMMFAKFDPKDIPETIKCGPMDIGHDYPATVLDMDPMKEIKDYAGPVCIIHGDKDQVVNVSYAEEAYETYMSQRDTDSGIPDENVFLHVLTGAKHGFSKKYDTLAIELVKEFLQGSRLMMKVDVELTGKTMTRTGLEMQVHLPFKGKADSRYFKGEILPGAADNQTITLKKHTACADYEIEGKDYTGSPCTVHIINRLENGTWHPTVTADSEALSFIGSKACRCVFEGRKQGPVIRIFCDTKKA